MGPNILPAGVTVTRWYFGQALHQAMPELIQKVEGRLTRDGDLIVQGMTYPAEGLAFTYEGAIEKIIQGLCEEVQVLEQKKVRLEWVKMTLRGLEISGYRVPTCPPKP